jgi:hypothetical protein
MCRRTTLCEARTRPSAATAGSTALGRNPYRNTEFPNYYHIKFVLDAEVLRGTGAVAPVEGCMTYERR